MKEIFKIYPTLRRKGEGFGGSPMNTTEIKEGESELDPKEKYKITSFIESTLQGIIDEPETIRIKRMNLLQNYLYGLTEEEKKFFRKARQDAYNSIFNSHDVTTNDILSYPSLKKREAFPKFSSEAEMLSYLKEKISQNSMNEDDQDYFSFFLNNNVGQSSKELRFDICEYIISMIPDREETLLSITALNYLLQNLSAFLEKIKINNKMIAFYYLTLLPRLLYKKNKGDDNKKIDELINTAVSFFGEQTNVLITSKFPVMSTFPKEEKIALLLSNNSFLEEILKHKNHPKYKDDKTILDIFSKIENAGDSELLEIFSNMSDYILSFLLTILNYETNGKVSEYEKSKVKQELDSNNNTNDDIYYTLAPHIETQYKMYSFKRKDWTEANAYPTYNNTETNFSSVTPDTLLRDSGLDTSKISNEELYAFQYSIQPKFRYGLQKRFNIDLGQLSIRTQFNLIHFFIESEEEWPKLVELLDLYGQDRNSRTNLMKVFTGLNIQENIDQLLDFAKVDPKTFKEFTETYSNIIDSSENLFAILNNETTNPRIYETFPLIKNKYIDKANTLFRKISNPQNTESPREAIEEASNINLDMISVSTIFAECKKSGDPISFDDFAKMDMRVLHGNEMSLDGAREIDVYIERMTKIYEENITNKDKIPDLIPTFKARAEDVNSEFHVLKLDSEIIAFIVFTKNPNGTYFASGLNVNKEMRGSGIGEVMMRETILEKMKESEVNGTVVGTKEVAIRYVKDGAIMFNPVIKANDTNLSIVWSKENQERYITKSATNADEIISLATRNPEIIKIVEIKSQDQIPFELCSSENEFVITRILKADETQDKKMLVVFERRQN